MRGHTQINSRQQAKNEYYKNTGQKLRIPAYQTNFLQPPQVAPSVKPPSIHKQTLKKPIFNNVDPLILKNYGKNPYNLLFNNQSNLKCISKIRLILKKIHK